MTKPLFSTNPHGAQELVEARGKIQANKEHKISEKWFTLRVVKVHGKGSITMTGEEIQSFCDEWKRYNNVYGDTGF